MKIRVGERNETSSWDVNSCAFAAGAAPGALYSGASIFEYLGAHMHQATAGSSRMARRGRWKRRRERETAIPSIRRHSSARFVPHALCIRGRCIIRTVRAPGVRGRHTRRRPPLLLSLAFSSLDRWIPSIAGAPPYVVPPLNRC